MSEELRKTLESIRPSVEGMIMDLVAEAGIDVTPWQKRTDGAPVKNPRANPHYCYEWAFGGEIQPTALCVWHRDAAISQDEIAYEDSLRQFALKLDLVAIERNNPAHVKSRARDQAKRARSFDSLLQRAFRKEKPIRVILLVGADKGAEQLGWDTSKVKYRSLDTAPWYVHSYSDLDGTFRLVRGTPLKSVMPQSEKSENVDLYVDQFSIPAQSDRVRVESSVLPRSQDVRRKVLLRAKGFCEYCGTAGFKMANGATYLETHHVIPLGKDGPDIEWNVVAVCPNDHRRAHYAEERDQIKQEMVAKLIRLMPLAGEALSTLAAGLSSGIEEN